jgi:hypothetical protein
MPTLEEIQDETVRAVNEKDDDEWDDENSDALVSGDWRTCQQSLENSFANSFNICGSSRTTAPMTKKSSQKRGVS